MNKKERIPVAVVIVSALLILHVLLLIFNGPVKVTGSLFAISPILVIWMVISVLKQEPDTGKEFQDGEEWGYADKNKEDLRTF